MIRVREYSVRLSVMVVFAELPSSLVRRIYVFPCLFLHIRYFVGPNADNLMNTEPDSARLARLTKTYRAVLIVQLSNLVDPTMSNAIVGCNKSRSSKELRSRIFCEGMQINAIYDRCEKEKG